eukprot:GHVP01012086.1.p1 GENE.GHVP01012086.1~~GHVP01012086.1.p1  ORF type:complete len:290 (-),score=52.43 GHVP01012086.1:511-1380(-)
MKKPIVFVCGDRYGRVRKVEVPSKNIIISQKVSSPVKFVGTLNKKRIVNVCEDGLIQILEPENLRRLGTLKIREQEVAAITLLEEQEILILFYESGAVLALDLSEPEEEKSTHEEAVVEDLTIDISDLPFLSFPGTREGKPTHQSADSVPAYELTLASLSCDAFRLQGFRVTPGKFQCAKRLSGMVAYGSEETNVRFVVFSTLESRKISVTAKFAGKNLPNTTLGLPQRNDPRCLHIFNERFLAIGNRVGRVLVFDMEESRQPFFVFPSFSRKLSYRIYDRDCQEAPRR